MGWEWRWVAHRVGWVVAVGHGRARGTAAVSAVAVVVCGLVTAALAAW